MMKFPQVHILLLPAAELPRNPFSVLLSHMTLAIPLDDVVRQDFDFWKCITW